MGWFAKLNPDLSLRVRAVPDKTLRIGVEAMRQIRRGEVYLAVPRIAILDRAQARASRIFGPALHEVSALFSGGTDSFHELLLFLMHERFLLRERSFFWPYLRLLPRADAQLQPYFLPDDVLARALAGSALLPAIRKQRDTIRRQYDQMIKGVILKKVLFFRDTAKAWSFRRYEWASFILNSRSIWWGGERH